MEIPVIPQAYIIGFVVVCVIIYVIFKYKPLKKKKKQTKSSSSSDAGDEFDMEKECMKIMKRQKKLFEDM